MTDSFFSVKNFSTYQHYKERNPPWVKLHNKILTSLEWIKGSDLSRSIQLASILLASRYSNQIPNDFSVIQPVLALRCTEAEFNAAIQFLVEYEFIEINNLTLVYQGASTALAKCSSQGEGEAEIDNLPKGKNINGSVPLPSFGNKPWGKAEKKAAWQSKICAEAQRTLSTDKYQAFLVAWDKKEPAAVQFAERLDRQLKGA